MNTSSLEEWYFGLFCLSALHVLIQDWGACWLYLGVGGLQPECLDEYHCLRFGEEHVWYLDAL